MRAPLAVASLASLAAIASIAAIAAITGTGCGEPCCTFDSRPISLLHASGGELLALASLDGEPAAGRLAIVDTGTPIALRDDSASGGEATARVTRATLRWFGAAGRGPGSGASAAPLRAVFKEVTLVRSTLGNAGLEGMPSRPALLIGGSFLVDRSVEIGFAAPDITFWPEQPASDEFLSAAGYGVLHVERHGGGELDTSAPAGGLGPPGPYQYPPSLLVLRACLAPDAFDRAAPLPTSCCAGEERTRATGANLSLLLGTGTGPVILGRSAWLRVRATTSAAPATTTPGPLLVATVAGPIAAEWAKVPRLALVDRETAASSDPGPCVELGRARRLEQVAWRQSQNADVAACALPCDSESRDTGRALNSAGYIEVDDEIDVAIIDDTHPLLQALRAQIRPEGPEIDGILGAAALRNTRIEIDYGHQPGRAIVSCEASAPAGTCRAAGRCPRLTARDQRRACFGLPAHGLPRMCENLSSSCTPAGQIRP